MKAILLAGGKSSRMNQDKPFLEFNDKFLIEIIVGQLENIFDKIIIVTNVNLIDKIKKMFVSNSSVEVITDIIPEKGPMGGLFTGFSSIPDEFLFLCSCDTPYISSDLINHMAGFIQNYDAVAPKFDGRLQPLFALYNRKIYAKIQQLIAENKLKMTQFIESIKLKVITESEIEHFNGNNLLFKNINTKEDYEEIKPAVVKYLHNKKGI